MSEQLVFGLDIGTRSIVGTVGYKQSLNDFTVVAQAIKMHDTRAMMDGQIHDINKVAETIEQVKRSLEKQVGQKLEEVCIAAAGRVLKTVTVHVSTEFQQEVTVNTEMIRALELLGVENAYNLDGGNSSALIYLGEKINAKSNPRHRPLSDIIYFASAVGAE